MKITRRRTQEESTTFLSNNLKKLRRPDKSGTKNIIETNNDKYEKQLKK